MLVNVMSEMLTCIEDNIKYHKKYLDKWNTLKGLMHGQRAWNLSHAWVTLIQHWDALSF